MKLKNIKLILLDVDGVHIRENLTFGKNFIKNFFVFSLFFDVIIAKI